MLSNTSRSLTYLNATLYAILGALLFFLPEQLAPVFAWKVTAFMTMTIGGWCLGNAWLAFFIARRWRWDLVYPSLFYLWLFGFGEVLIVYLFRGKLALDHWIAWLYLSTLVVNVLTALVGMFDMFRSPLISDSSSAKTSGIQYALLLSFIVAVGFIGFYGLSAKQGDLGTNGGIFPEIMSPFTLRSFGAFYAALSVSVIPLLWKRNLKAYLSHGFVSYGLIIFITAAAIVYLRLFDFAARLGGLLYFGLYLAVAIVFLFNFKKYGTGTR